MVPGVLERTLQKDKNPGAEMAPGFFCVNYAEVCESETGHIAGADITGSGVPFLANAC